MAVCIHGTEDQWLEMVEVDLRLKNDDSGILHGKRIVHISDLHYSKTVSSKYLNACIKRINALNPDIILLTGDYITHDVRGKFTNKIVSILSNLRASQGVYACLGNHDYGADGFFSKLRNSRLEEFVDDMHNVGIKVLRNESEQIELNGQPINLVGLGDVWAGDFDCDKSFAKIKSDIPTIVLSHNPHSIEYLGNYHFSTAMCGHTHGSKYILTPSARWPFVKKTHHQYNSGLYQIADKSFYVNRGLGRLGRARLNAPPEITVYNLK